MDGTTATDHISFKERNFRTYSFRFKDDDGVDYGFVDVAYNRIASGSTIGKITWDDKLTGINWSGAGGGTKKRAYIKFKNTQAVATRAGNIGTLGFHQLTSQQKFIGSHYNSSYKATFKRLYQANKNNFPDKEQAAAYKRIMSKTFTAVRK